MQFKCRKFRQQKFLLLNFFKPSLLLWISLLGFEVANSASLANVQSPVRPYCETIPSAPLDPVDFSTYPKDLLEFDRDLPSRFKNDSRPVFETETGEQVEALSSLSQNLKYIVKKLPEAYPSRNPRREITFPNLSFEQFNSLKERFGMNLSVLKYDKNLVYKLQDFLPPNLQAALEFAPVSNCFGFIQNYLEADGHQIRIAFRHDSLVSRLQDPEKFRMLKKGEKMAVGDIIVTAMDPSMDPSIRRTLKSFVIDHAVVYLDEFLSIGSNPDGMLHGSIMDGRFTRNKFGDMVPLGSVFENGIFTGDSDLNWNPENSNFFKVLVFRRVDFKDARIDFQRFVSEPSETRPRPIEFAVAAFLLNTDQFGRVTADRDSGISCIPDAN